MTEHQPPPIGAFLRPVGHYSYSYKVLAVHAPTDEDRREVVVLERWGLKDRLPINDGHVRRGFSLSGLLRVLPGVWRDVAAGRMGPLYYRIVAPSERATSTPQLSGELVDAPIPPGFVLVDVVLPARQAYIVRRWAEQARPAIRVRVAAEGGEKKGFSVGQRYVLADTERTRMQKRVGVRVVLTKIFWESQQVFAHDDEPVRFKVNSRGRKVVAFDPACIETVYGFDELRPTT